MVDFLNVQEIETFGQILEQRDILKEYEIQQEIGSGEYAKVFKAVKNQKTYAIKVISKSRLKYNQQKYLFQEVFVLKSMNNENTVQMIEQAEWEDDLIIVMEYCEQNLREFLKDKQFGLLGMPENEVIEAFFQILKGMLFLHTNNFIHRDIKLENILVKNQNIFKIADFGFTKQTASDNKQVQPGTFVGTLRYMAPEMLMGENHNYKIDVWSLGTVLIQLLLGVDQFPFNGKTQVNSINLIKNHFQQNQLLNLEEIFNPQTIIKKNMKQEEIQIIEQRFNKVKSISKECLDLIQKMMVLDLNKRFDTQQIIELNIFQQFKEVPQFMQSSKFFYNQKLEHEFSFQLQRCKFIKNLSFQIKNQKPEIIGPQQTICYFLYKTQLFFLTQLKLSCQNYRYRSDLFKIGLEWWNQFEKSQEYNYMFASLLADIHECENELNNNKQNVLQEVAVSPQLNSQLEYIKQNMEISIFSDSNQQFKICFRQINNIAIYKLSDQLAKQGQYQDIELVKLSLKILSSSCINQMICESQFISQVFSQYVKEKPDDNLNNLGNFFDNYDAWINSNKSKTSLFNQYKHLENCFFKRK